MVLYIATKWSAITTLSFYSTINKAGYAFQA